MAETFEDLRAWQTARALTDAVYKHTKSGAFSKDFGLRDQIQRAAVSIMSNIAEGFESRTRSQFISYFGQSLRWRNSLPARRGQRQGLSHGGQI